MQPLPLFNRRQYRSGKHRCKHETLSRDFCLFSPHPLSVRFGLRIPNAIASIAVFELSGTSAPPIIETPQSGSPVPNLVLKPFHGKNPVVCPVNGFSFGGFGLHSNGVPFPRTSRGSWIAAGVGRALQ